MAGPFEGSSTEQTAKILADVYDAVNHRLNTIGVGGAGGVVTIADGADVALGAQADAAVTGDTAGTLSAKMRGLLKIITDVYDPVTHQLKVLSAGGGGGLTDVQLRAAPVPVTDALGATEATLLLAKLVLDLIRAKTDNLDIALSTRTKPADQQHAIVDSSALPTGAATEATLATRAADATLTSGTQKAIARGAAKGATPAADVTATSIDADHTGLDVKVQGPVAVTGPLTDAQLRAAAVPTSVADGVDVAQGSTADLDTAMTVIGRLKKIVGQTAGLALDATATAIRDRLPAALVGGRLSVDVGASVLPTGASTEATLALIKAKTDNIDVLLSTRAVTGLTDAQLRAAAVPVSGPLTDAQLRAAVVPVSIAALDVLLSTRATEATLAAVLAALASVAVTGPLTDAQLRAAAVAVTAAQGTPQADLSKAWPTILTHSSAPFRTFDMEFNRMRRSAEADGGELRRAKLTRRTWLHGAPDSAATGSRRSTSRFEDA
jgi:hypothetical protein